MKDKNGIEIKCKNCANYGTYLFMPCLLCSRKNAGFKPTVESYEARIVELQNSLDKIEKKLTETVKLLSERSRECGELQALLEVKNRSDISPQSTDAADVSKNGEKSTESEK